MHRYRAFRSIRPLTSCLSLGGAILAGHACVSQPLDEGVSANTTPLTVSPTLDFVQTPGGQTYKLQGVVSGAEQSRYVVAKLNSAPTEAVRSALTLAGYRIMTYLPTNALLLERVGDAAQSLNAMMELDAVAGVAPYAKADRLSSELTSSYVAELRTEQVPILVHVMPGHESADVVALLKERGIEVFGNGAAGEWTRVSAVVSKQQAAEVADALTGVSDVFYVERIHHLGFFNDKSAGTVQSGMQGKAAGVTPIWAKGLKGEGQILGIIDSGLDVDSCYFKDTDAAKLPKTNTYTGTYPNGTYPSEVDASHRKVIAYDFLYSCAQWPSASGCEEPSQTNKWDDNNHGTHCSGNMAGDSSTAANNGMAPAAKLVMQDGGAATNACSDMPGLGCPVITLVPIFDQAYKQGVRIHNNSYGDQEDTPVPKGSNYTARSQDVDKAMWDHKDMLIVFAAGNSGAGNAEFSVYSPSTNKNGLSVGSTRTAATSASDNDLSSFSSRGWTSDGRIKPDILAPGCNASAGNDKNVTTGNCGGDSGCGTSYAAPTLVGAAALVRQYFTEGFYPSGAKNAADAMAAPSAALMKGVLLNSAMAITGKDNAGGAITPIPSNEQGWGQVQLAQSLVFTGGTKKLYVDDHKATFAAGATDKVSYTFKGVTGAVPLKVTLTWTDFPGTPDSTKASPKVADETTWSAPVLVNNLDLTVATGADTYLGNAFAAGVSTKGGKADVRNNTEQVLFAAPTAGDYTITVNPTNIAMAGQDFALVVTGQWTSVETGTTPPPGDGGVGTGGTSGGTSTGNVTGGTSGGTASGGTATGGTTAGTGGTGATSGGTASNGGASGGTTFSDDDASVPGDSNGGPKGPNNTTGGGTGFPTTGGTGGGGGGGCSVSEGRGPSNGWLALSALASVIGLAGVRRKRARRMF